jgi:hypothetical protein
MDAAYVDGIAGGAESLWTSSIVFANSDLFGSHLQEQYLSGRVDIVVRRADAAAMHEMLCRRSVIGIYVTFR